MNADGTSRQSSSPHRGYFPPTSECLGFGEAAQVDPLFWLRKDFSDSTPCSSWAILLSHRFVTFPLLASYGIRSTQFALSFHRSSALTSSSRRPYSRRSTDLLSRQLLSNPFHPSINHLRKYIHHAWRSGDHWYGGHLACRGSRHPQGVPHVRLCRIWRYLFRLRYWLDVRSVGHAIFHPTIYWPPLSRLK